MSIKKLKKEMSKSLKDDYVLMVDDDISHVETFVSTGCTALDYIISNRRDGGLPVGVISELAGLPSAGKSLMAIHVCAEAQRSGGFCIYLDSENAFNPDFAQRVGLNTSDESFWLPEPPPTVEAVFKFLFDFCKQMEELKKAGEWKYKFVVIVWDSVASTPCAADVLNENPDPAANVGLKPRILSKNFATFVGMAAKKDILFLCVNQLRNNIGAMPGADKYISPGGNAIPFYTSVRVRLSSAGKLKDKSAVDDVIGVNTLAEIKKTRFGPPHRKVEFPIYFTHGIDDPESIIEALEKRKGIQIIPGGSRGKLICFEGQDKKDAIRKVDFKRLYLTDPEFKVKVLDAFEKVMTLDLTDPRFKELEVEAETD